MAYGALSRQLKKPQNLADSLILIGREMVSRTNQIAISPDKNNNCSALGQKILIIFQLSAEPTVGQFGDRRQNSSKRAFKVKLAHT